jgi:hypothetical protein
MLHDRYFKENEKGWEFSSVFDLPSMQASWKIFLKKCTQIKDQYSKHI